MVLFAGLALDLSGSLRKLSILFAIRTPVPFAILYDIPQNKKNPLRYFCQYSLPFKFKLAHKFSFTHSH